MTDIRETIARAIHDADEVGNYPSQFSWEDDAQENREDYRKLADAVLAVLPAPVRCNLCGHKRVCVR